MCELHPVVLYIYDQNTTIKMFVVVFCSFVVFCVVLVILGHDAFVQSRPWMLFLLSMTKHSLSSLYSIQGIMSMS